MFMNDVYKKDEIKDVAIQDLRRMGVKYRKKKSKPPVQETKKTIKCFKVELQFLPTQVVTLSDGQQLVVPVIIHNLCSFILKKCDTEGLFRKEGSKSRQNEIKLSLNAGCKIEEDYHVIDVAGILKTFLRELPEPVIPTTYHDHFLKCMILDKEKLNAVLLLCLLLPQEHLNTLVYLLRFLKAISTHSEENKMTASNLAIVLGPNLIPFAQDKTSFTTQHRIKKICELLQLLIENANKVGIIPDYIIDQVADSTSKDDLVVDKKKKRRSGSLTRMFNGLKKMVGNKSEEMSPTVVTPDLLLTPSISRSVKKRKIESLALSNKKKKDVINNLPERKILKMPYAPASTPISENPNPKTDKTKNLLKHNEDKNFQNKDKKSQWYSRSKVLKHSKPESEENIRASRLSLGTRAIIERRWSAVSTAGFRKSKKGKLDSGSHQNLHHDFPENKSEITNGLEIGGSVEDGFVKISKVEYEEIKNRVSEIERKISLEIGNVQSEIKSANNKQNIGILDPVKDVQSAYEQTLVHTEPLSPTTDHLARRLSRELKIRRSCDHIVIRSPSARKIGNLKRRSRELETKNCKLTRNQSWHLGTISIPRVNVRKDRASSVRSDYHILPNNIEVKHMSTPELSDRVLRSAFNKTNSSSSLNTSEKTSFHSAISSGFPEDVSAHWTSADKFFTNVKTPNNKENSSLQGRPSVAELRNQNVGMVLAKAKLFDKLIDSDNPNENSNGKTELNQNNHKIGAVRQNDYKLSYKVRNLKSKKISSPRRSRVNLSQRQKLYTAKHLVEGHRNKNLSMTPPDKVNPFSIDQGMISPIKFTPRKTPVIKKALLTRSPKRLCKSSHADRSTPLKVFTPKPMEY